MKTISRRTFLGWAGAAAGLSTGLFPGVALSSQQVETLRIVVGFAPGGTADTVGRWLGNAMGGKYARTGVVDNRTGAGGQIAIQAVRSLPADGANILVTPASMLVIYPHTYQSLPYDPMTDLTPISIACSFDYGFGVGPMVPESVTNIEEFLAWAKANPSSANFGSPAAGSTPHFVGELVARAGGVDMRHVAYRGSQPAIVEMMGGQIAAVSGPLGEFLQHLPSGKARLLATSGKERSRFTPSVPTYREQGLEDIVFDEWFGVFGPPNMSPEAVSALNEAVREALKDPKVVEGLDAMALDPTPSSPDELRARIKHDLDLWEPIVKQIGFKVD